MKKVVQISGKSFPVTNPTNGEVIANVPDMDGKDVRRAIEAAHTVTKYTNL